MANDRTIADGLNGDESLWPSADEHSIVPLACPSNLAGVDSSKRPIRLRI